VRAKYGIASTKEQLQEQFENEIRQSMRKKTDTPFSLFLKRIYFLLFILPKYKRGSD
jgi:1,2-phenylacetyl-CoA epoxidase catalytic subunit